MQRESTISISTEPVPIVAKKIEPPNFKGSLVLFDKNSRKLLPFQILDEPVPFWKMLKNLIGQDLTKVSLPVIMNEPHSAIQRVAEGVCGGDRFWS